jgi:hypothetical protein
MATYDNTDTLEQTQQQAAISNPPHADVSPQPIKTPREVQAGLAALIARYSFRALTKTLTSSALPDAVHKYTGTNFLRDKLFADHHIANVNAKLQEFAPQAQTLFPNAATMDEADIARGIRKSPEAKKVNEELKNILKRWDGASLNHNTLQYFIKEPHKGGISLESRGRIKSKMSGALFEIYYDTMLGVGSMFYTRAMQQGVRKDITNIYSEAVALEQNKVPSEIGEQDIAESSNEIIQSTTKNHQRKRAIRYGISALPFLRWAPPLRAVQWGEFAIGGWGGLWAADVWGRNPTMLENFRSFVNNKLNPLYGIGDTIKPSEIVDLYQQYAFRFQPDIAFKAISINDEDANRMWAQSEKLFNRISDLMNESYNFKHRTILDPETNTPQITADFTLPKFIYLMGHGLVNARKPEWSMAFVELANKFPDMDAVKDASKAMRNNVSLSEIVEKYGIELNPTGHHNGYEKQADTSQPVKKPPAKEPFPDAKPDTSVKLESLEKAANLAHEPATTTRASA